MPRGSKRWRLSDYLGTPPAFERGVAAAAGGRAVRGEAAARAAAPPLKVDVVCGDIDQAEGDVYAVGHDQGVIPQNAELALDRAISAGGLDEEHLVLTEHSRRGLLRGELGDVEFFPWNRDAGGRRRHGPSRLVRRSPAAPTGADLAWSVASLPRPRSICTVLIGAGEGNLTVEAAVSAMFRGLADALLDASIKSRIGRLRIVELFRGRAQEILDALEAVRSDAEIASRIRLESGPGCAGRRRRPEPRGGPRSLPGHGRQGPDIAPGPDAKGAEHVAGRAAAGEGAEAPGLAHARRAGPATRAASASGSATWRRTATTSDADLVACADAGAIRAAAITDTATVGGRSLTLDPRLADELVARTTDPDPSATTRCRSSCRAGRSRASPPRLYPARPGSFVFEVDRSRWRASTGRSASSDERWGDGTAPLGRGPRSPASSAPPTARAGRAEARRRSVPRARSWSAIPAIRRRATPCPAPAARPWPARRVPAQAQHDRRRDAHRRAGQRRSAAARASPPRPARGAGPS